MNAEERLKNLTEDEKFALRLGSALLKSWLLALGLAVSAYFINTPTLFSLNKLEGSLLALFCSGPILSFISSAYVSLTPRKPGQ
ncbi:MAG: hypothetical protein AAF975_00095 [Spirochaetota bacterium]